MFKIGVAPGPAPIHQTKDGRELTV
jgi:hypothetical protein